MICNDRTLIKCIFKVNICYKMLVFSVLVYKCTCQVGQYLQIKSIAMRKSLKDIFFKIKA